MKDTLNDESRPHGVLPYYGIELYDIDNDSIPEMQELRPSASQPGYYKVWFVNNGQAKHMIISERVRSPCFK
jgi:hypothetical protein